MIRIQKELYEEVTSVFSSMSLFLLPLSHVNSYNNLKSHNRVPLTLVLWFLTILKFSMNTLVFLFICRPKYKKSSVKTVVNYAKQREVMNTSELQNTLFIKNARNGPLAPVLKNLCLLQFVASVQSNFMQKV